MLCFEIDDKISPIITFNKCQRVIYGDFTKKVIHTKFKTIIGNPPYVKQKMGKNLYIKFVELCYEYLEDNGELLFIVPSDFIKLTSASKIINKMSENGSFTDFFFLHNEKLFKDASIDVVVFRYEKGLKTNKSLLYHSTYSTHKEVYCNIHNGIVTFSDDKIESTKIIENMFDVYVGIVSGRDEIYKVSYGNIEVLSDQNRVDQFIYTEVFPTDNQQINDRLLSYKKELMERKIKKFSENNWFEWGAPRNIKNIIKNWGKDCIYVRNMTRKKEVAFIDKVRYFGGSLLCLVPKEEIDFSYLKKICEYLNSDNCKKDYLYAGRFKIGHKQICNISII
jgi:adenine-specific DNA-methyltransferase